MSSSRAKGLKLMLVQDTALFIPLCTYCPKGLPKGFYIPGTHPYALNTVNLLKTNKSPPITLKTSSN